MASESTPVDSQVLYASELVAASRLAPFEGGLVTVSPLRPLTIRFGREEEAESLSIVAGYLATFVGSPNSVVSVQSSVGTELVPVADLETYPHRIESVDVPASDEFGSAAIDPRAMQRITARLRRPDGCPWDRKQTHQSLAKNFVDEVYEVVDAIESGDPAAIAEELGDLFLLIMMEAQIGHEAGTFSIEDVYAGIARKIVGRHPHVFGEAVVETDADLFGVWAAAKDRETAEGRKHGGKDVDGEPFSMPALTRATRVLTRNPVTPDADTPELLRIVGEMIARGEDPDAVLKVQLREHVARQTNTT